MRKLKRRKEFSINKIIIIFVACIITFSVGYSVLSEQLSIEGTVNLVTEDSDINEFKNNNLKLTYDVQTWYSSGLNYYQYDFTLTNIGTEVVNNWSVFIEVINDLRIASGWSVDYGINGNQLSLTSLSYNSTLNPGNQVSFGIQVTSSNSDFKIRKVNLNGDVISDDPEEPDNPEEPDEELEVVFKKGSNWGQPGEYYIQYDITLTNKTNIDINPWSFEFSVPEGTTIFNGWGFNYVNADGIIRVSPANYNKNLAAGSSISIGLQLKCATLNIQLKKK